LPSVAAKGAASARSALGNRKDIRNAVEAARGAANGLGERPRARRAQVLYYLAENLARAPASSRRGSRHDRRRPAKARDAEVEAPCAACSPTAPGPTNTKGPSTPAAARRGARDERADGRVGIVCPDEAPLLAFVSLVAPADRDGQPVGVVPSERHPLPRRLLPGARHVRPAGGVVNIVTGQRDALAKTLAEHDDVDAVWAFGAKEALGDGGAAVDRQPQAHAGRRRRAGAVRRQLPGRFRRAPDRPRARAAHRRRGHHGRRARHPLGDAAGRRRGAAGAPDGDRGRARHVSPVQQEVQAEIDRAEGRVWTMGSIERFAFYEAARKAYCVIATGERRFYGCFLFKKGVLAPEAA
jgi:hypothetical protein